MKKKLNTFLMAGAVSLSVLLAACGAGNISQSASQMQQVKGVAASGAPVVGTITLKDASVPARIRTTTSASNGSFSLNVNGLTPPFILTATWTDSSGANLMYSFAEGPGTANINPFSNAAFAAAAEVDPSTLPADPDPVLIRDMTSRHQSIIHQLMQKLSSLFALYGATQNPVDDEYEADHTGLDAMFDDIRISVSNGMITVKNKQTGSIIFTAPVNNIDAGIFYPENMPGQPGQTDGASLYTNYCSSCHGPLATSSKQGVTANQIQSAIQHVDAMDSLRLSAYQIQAIASVLSSTVTSTPTPTTAPVACTYTYDVWGACQSNNTQTRNVLTTSPSGCTGTPVVSQSCTYVPPTPGACTYTYAAWSACQSNNTQTRNVLTTTPTGCTGTPVTSQACTYVAPSCTYTYDVWGACESNNTQTRNVLTTTPTGCTGTPVTSQACTYVAPSCTYTYDVWGACQSNNTQTRNVLTTTPTGCSGTPVTSQACTYTPPACTYTYSAWGACQSNSTQTRNLLTTSPAGCTGTPLLSQSCTYTPPSTVTLAQVTSSCTGCHGLTVNTTVLKSGGYTVTGRTATTWLSTVNSMVGKGASLASGTTAQDYANFLATLP